METRREVWYIVDQNYLSQTRRIQLHHIVCENLRIVDRIAHRCVKLVGEYGADLHTITLRNVCDRISNYV